MKIIYTGELASGSIDTASGEFRFAKGQPLDVPDETGKALVARGDFKAADNDKQKPEPHRKYSWKMPAENDSTL